MYKFFCRTFSLGIYLGVKLLGHMITLCLIFWGPAKLFFKAVAPFYIPTSKVWGIQFLHIIKTCYYLFFSLFFWLHWVLVAACRIFVEACSNFHCSAQSLCCDAGFFLVVACGFLSSGVQVSLYLWCAGFLFLVVARGLQGAWALQLWHAGSRAHGLCSLWHEGSLVEACELSSCGAQHVGNMNRPITSTEIETLIKKPPTGCRNVNWYSHYGEQYGGSLKN